MEIIKGRHSMQQVLPLLQLNTLPAYQEEIQLLLQQLDDECNLFFL